jgi:hypothetical protein
VKAVSFKIIPEEILWHGVGWIGLILEKWRSFFENGNKTSSFILERTISFSRTVFHEFR